MSKGQHDIHITQQRNVENVGRGDPIVICHNCGFSLPFASMSSLLDPPHWRLRMALLSDSLASDPDKDALLLAGN